MNLNILSKVISILIILLNIYFVPLTVKQIYTGGGAMGYGLLLIPFTLTFNLFLITAIKSFEKQNENNLTLLIVNSIGLLIGIFLFGIVITT